MLKDMLKLFSPKTVECKECNVPLITQEDAELHEKATSHTTAKEYKINPSESLAWINEVLILYVLTIGIYLIYYSMYPVYKVASWAYSKL